MTSSTASLPPGLLAESAACRVELAHPVFRFSLRARGDLSPLNNALGFTLPAEIGGRAEQETVQALCLGPDEWVLQVTQSNDAATLQAACAQVYEALPHSLVDISGRELTFAIEGPRAAELLTLGCPRDIDTISVGSGCRTIFDGATVILWRDSDTAFRMDCWNSFADHLLHLLQTGCRELEADIS